MPDEEKICNNECMKKKGKIVIALLLITSILLAIAYRFNYIPHRKYTNADFGIETYISSVDMDNDGIDDQTDILQSAREYLASKPKYKSKYYAGGYPDDEYGVCTDVVAYGLLGTGYDLMELVNQDILLYPDAYAIDIVDKNIDFRRVRNLKVYFEHTAISLTTDIHDIAQWQGGDIVIFKDHIGIISDKRNKNGVPFLIHHGSAFQRYYEEDVLEERDDITAHYRIS